jgi:hypothetical protein
VQPLTARLSTQAPRAPRQAQPGQAPLIRGIAQSSSSTQDVAGNDDIIESSSKRARTDDDEDDGTSSGGAEVEYNDYPMFDENDVVQTIEKDDHNESFELVSPSVIQSASSTNHRRLLKKFVSLQLLHSSMHKTSTHKISTHKTSTHKTSTHKTSTHKTSTHKT